MDAVDFIKGFDSDNMPITVMNHFDEIMVLYNLVGHRQDLDICTENDGAPAATFILLMDSESDAVDLYNNLNNTDFTVYGNTYDISMQLNQASISTTINKASSL